MLLEMKKGELYKNISSVSISATERENYFVSFRILTQETFLVLERIIDLKENGRGIVYQVKILYKNQIGWLWIGSYEENFYQKVDD